jgi:hypothetical protein
LSPEEGFSVSPEGHTLQVSDASPASLKQPITCTAENSVGKALASSHVSVFGPHNLQVRPLHTTLNQGEHARLDCELRDWGDSSAPKPKLRWEVNGKPLEPEKGRTFLLDNHSLFISRALRADSGNYTCVSDFGEAKIGASTTLRVLGTRPKVTVAPPPFLRAFAGDPVRMVCNAVGVPQPLLTWRRDGFPMGDARLPEPPGEGLTLLIANATKAHAGNYSCLAQNMYGTAASPLGRLQVVLRTGQRQQQGAATVAVEGLPAAVPCPLFVDPDLRVTALYRWYKGRERESLLAGPWSAATDSSTLQPPPPAFSVGAGGSLLVSSPRLEDSGDYTCRVTTAAEDILGGASLWVSPGQSKKFRTTLALVAAALCLLAVLWGGFCCSLRARSRTAGAQPGQTPVAATATAPPPEEDCSQVLALSCSQGQPLLDFHLPPPEVPLLLPNVAETAV